MFVSFHVQRYIWFILIFFSFREEGGGGWQIFFFIAPSSFNDLIILIPIVIYQGLELAKPVDVYNMLGSQISSDKQNVKIKTPFVCNSMSDKSGTQFIYKYGGLATKGLKKLESISKSLKSRLTSNDIQNLSHSLKLILHK